MTSTSSHVTPCGVVTHSVLEGGPGHRVCEMLHWALPVGILSFFLATNMVSPVPLVGV